MPKIHRGRPPTYPVGVLPTVAEPSEVPKPPKALSPPAASARIGLWRDYAASLGIDTEGLTKPQIKKAVA